MFTITIYPIKNICPDIYTTHLYLEFVHYLNAGRETGRRRKKYISSRSCCDL